MITAVLTAATAWCLLYGRLPGALLAAACVLAGLLLARLGRHGHSRFLMIDVLAQTSGLGRVNAGLKFWTVLVLMGLCVSAKSPWVGLGLAALMLALTVCVGGLGLGQYLRLLALPVSFLLLGGLALLFQVAGEPVGVLNLPLLGRWLCVTTQAQATASLVMARALGAVSCLYLLSLSTPMPQIIGVLRRIRCPKVVINLMYLIYRYLFVLFSMYYAMKDAANSRLGYRGCRAGLRTTGGIYANLLARSYRQASRNFDAMESRCFDGEIRFLEQATALRGGHIAACLAIGLLTLALSLVLGGGV